MSNAKAKGLEQIHDEEEGDGEELWLVSYADMVTLLFGFFVILYSFSTLDDKKFDAFSEKLAEAFKAKVEKKASDSDLGFNNEARQLRALQLLITMLNLGENTDDAVKNIEETYAQSRSAEAAKAVLLEKVAPEHKDLVSAVRQHGEHEDLQIIELMLPASSLFQPGSDQIAPAAQAKVRALAVDLGRIADLAEIEVDGHTDSQPPPATAAYRDNLTLSSLRAGAIGALLLQGGVPPEKLTLRGLGSLHPLLPERDAQGRFLAGNAAQNRRVGLVLKLRHGPPHAGK